MPAIDDQRHLARIHWCCDHVSKYAAKLGKKDFGHGNANFDALCWHLSILGAAASQIRDPAMTEPIKTERLVVGWETLVRLPAILMPDENEPHRFEDFFPVSDLFDEFLRDAIPQVQKAVKTRLTKPSAREEAEE